MWLSQSLCGARLQFFRDLQSVSNKCVRPDRLGVFKSKHIQLLRVSPIAPAFASPTQRESNPPNNRRSDIFRRVARYLSANIGMARPTPHAVGV